MAKQLWRLSAWFKNTLREASPTSNAADHPAPRPLLDFTKDVIAEVVDQRKKSVGVGKLEQAIVFKDHLFDYPGGNSRDYAGKIREFVDGCLSQCKPCAEKVDLLERLSEPGLSRDFNRFESLVQHHFFKTEEEKAIYLQAFVRSYRGKNIPGTNKKWEELYNEWEKEKYPHLDVPQNIYLVVTNAYLNLKVGVHVWKVYRNHIINQHKKKNGPSYVDFKVILTNAREDEDRADRVRFCRDLLEHINDGINNPADEYSMVETYHLIEDHLFPGITLRVYQFCKEFGLEVKN